MMNIHSSRANANMLLAHTPTHAQATKCTGWVGVWVGGLWVVGGFPVPERQARALR